MILRRIVVPLVATYALFIGMAVWAWRHPSERGVRPTAAGWGGALRYLAVTMVGGYLCFLLIVLVFHVLIAGQRGALSSAVTGGGVLAFAVATPAFLLSMWISSRR